MNKIKKFLIVTVLALGVSANIVGTAFADNGPGDEPRPVAPIDTTITTTSDVVVLGSGGPGDEPRP